MTTAAAAAYQYRATDTLPFYALKRRKAQKQSGFRAKSTYGHCIKDKALIESKLLRLILMEKKPLDRLC